MTELFWNLIGSAEFASLAILAISGLAAYAAKWIRAQWLKQVDEKDRMYIEDRAAKAVIFAEQMLKNTDEGKALDELRREKLDLAVAQLDDWLRSMGIKLTGQQLIAEVEYAVASVLQHKS